MQVSKSVYCRIGEDGGSNNGFIVCSDCCVVVDTATFPDQTQKDVDDMREITDKKVKFLINTHYHSDHTFGNMYFTDIIAHENCYNKLKEVTPLYMKRIQEDEENRNRFRKFTVKLPTIVFTDTLILHETPEIVIRYYGGHTEGSATVLIPKENVLFAGDLLFEGSHPYLIDADILQWIKALEDVLQLNVSQIIPGHGRLCGNQEVKTHIEYLNTFYNTLKNLKTEFTKEEISKNPDLLRLPRKSKEERIVRNIEVQYDRI